MAVVSMMRMQGDPDELLGKIQEHLDPIAMRLADKHGGILNVVARDGDGILMINLWETEEGRHAMAEEPEIQEALRAAGLPAPDFEGHEVLSLNMTDRVAALTTSR